MRFFRRLLEGVFINFIWWVCQAIIVSIPLIVALSYPSIFSNVLLCILAAVVTITLLCLIWYFGWRYYPSFSWNIIHGHNTYTLTYKQREVAHYEKRIEAIPLRKHLESFPEGEYRWSGSDSNLTIAESADFTLRCERESDSRVEYIVCPKGVVKAYKPLRYTLNVELKDENKTAIPKNYIYIKRPTKKITLILKIAVDIPICDVRFIAKTKYGEESKLIHKPGHPIQENGYNTYTFNIRRPKMFCEYEICWTWVNKT